MPFQFRFDVQLSGFRFFSTHVRRIPGSCKAGPGSSKTWPCYSRGARGRASARCARWRKTRSGKPNGYKEEIEAGSIAAVIDYATPDNFPDVITAIDAGSISNQIDSWKSEIAAFPNVRSLLIPRIHSFALELARYQAGQRKYKGIWYSQADYAKRIQEEAAVAASETLRNKQKEELAGAIASSTPEVHPVSGETYFLLQRVSIMTDSGVVGLSPATKVTLIDAGPPIRVTDGNYQFNVEPAQLTNDLSVATRSFQADQAAQSAINSTTNQGAQNDLKQQNNAYIQQLRTQEDHELAPLEDAISQDNGKLNTLNCLLGTSGIYTSGEKIGFEHDISSLRDDIEDIQSQIKTIRERYQQQEQALTPR